MGLKQMLAPNSGLALRWFKSNRSASLLGDSDGRAGSQVSHSSGHLIAHDRSHQAGWKVIKLIEQAICITRVHLLKQHMQTIEGANLSLELGGAPTRELKLSRALVRRYSKP